MAPESGSGPGEDGRPSPTAGWHPIGGELEILKLDPNHPEYPGNLRDEAADMESLAKDEAVAAAVERLNRSYAEKTEPEIRAWFRRCQIAEQRGDFAALEGLSEQYRSCIAQALHDIGVEARSTGPAGIPIPTRIKYLAERVLPPFYAEQITDPKTEPFVLLVNRTERIAVPLLLQPGEVLLKFSGIRTGDLVDHIVPLLTEARGLVGDHPSKGGRRADEEKALAVSRLRVTEPKIKAWEIADRVGIECRGNCTGTVRWWRAKGDKLHAERLGPNWKKRIKEETMDR